MTDANQTLPTTDKPDGANPGGQGDAGKPKPEFSAEQMAEIGRIVSKERKDAATKAAADAQSARDAADDQARKDREADDAKKRGDFERVETAIKADLDAAKTERDGLKAENDRLRAAVEGVLADEWKKLPSEVRDAYLGADDDPLAKMAFLPKGKALAEKLAGGAQRGNGSNPPTGGGTAPTLDQTKQEMRALMGIRR